MILILHQDDRNISSYIKKLKATDADVKLEDHDYNVKKYATKIKNQHGSKLLMARVKFIYQPVIEGNQGK